MKPWVAAGLALLAGGAHAATAYVTDELVLGVYPDPSTQGQRLTTLHSGARVETLAANGDATQVRLQDGIVGWVKTSYLTDVVPAKVKVKELQDELDRTHATNSDMAEAAEHREVLRLTQELALRDGRQTPAGRPPQPASTDTATTAMPGARRLWQWAAAVLAALALGFGAGYGWLARRIRRKFGGIRLY